jgi:7-carboxy-7-deazaguanine synthase
VRGVGVTIRVNEIFYSIQGEASCAGQPCVFIRLAGCNLRCRYCDTAYAYDAGDLLDIRDILRRIERYPCRLVEVTGGEPLVQSGTPVLIARLLETGYRVLLETNGSLDVSGIDGRCVKIIDLKCPSSGEDRSTYADNFRRLTPRDEIKCVIADRRDYDYARQALTDYRLLGSGRRIHFSPVNGRLSPAQLAGWMCDDGLPVRLNLQLHRIIWPGVSRGV